MVADTGIVDCCGVGLRESAAGCGAGREVTRIGVIGGIRKTKFAYVLTVLDGVCCALLFEGVSDDRCVCGSCVC